MWLASASWRTLKFLKLRQNSHGRLSSELAPVTQTSPKPERVRALRRFATLLQFWVGFGRFVERCRLEKGLSDSAGNASLASRPPGIDRPIAKKDYSAAYATSSLLRPVFNESPPCAKTKFECNRRFFYLGFRRKSRTPRDQRHSNERFGNNGKVIARPAHRRLAMVWGTSLKELGRDPTLAH